MSRSPAQARQTEQIHADLRAREDAVLRAGWPSLHAAERALYRRGRHDLARPLAALTSRARRAA